MLYRHFIRLAEPLHFWFAPTPTRGRAAVVVAEFKSSRLVQAKLEALCRQPHLTGDDAKDLLEQSLARYSSEHKTAPARVMLHKTSPSPPKNWKASGRQPRRSTSAMLELVWIPRRSHPPVPPGRPESPLRGTLLSLTDKRHLLYTRGRVARYRINPGMYVPGPLPFRVGRHRVQPGTDCRRTAAALQDELERHPTRRKGPITLRTADSIGRILKHLGRRTTGAALRVLHVTRSANL